MKERPSLTPIEELTEAERRINNPTIREDIIDFFARALLGTRWDRQRRLDEARKQYRQRQQLEASHTTDGFGEKS
jgi:Flp pilus assembly protein TadD